MQIIECDRKKVSFINRKSWFGNMKYILILILFAYTFAQSVNISSSSCTELLELLKYLKDRPTKHLAEKKIDKLLSHKDYQVLFSFYKNDISRNLNNSTLKKIMIGLAWPETYKRGRDLLADLIMAKWEIVYNNLEHLEDKINEIKKINLRGLINISVRTSNNWLPSNMQARSFNFIIIGDGYSAGYKVGNNQVYDIFQIPITRIGKIDEQLFGEIIAHESHHSGLKLPNKFNSKKEYLLTRFFAPFISEGSATKFVNNVFGKYTESIDQKKKVLYFSVIPGINFEPEWRRLFDEEDYMFERFFMAIQNILNGRYSEREIENELKSYWMAPGSARHYLLGSEIMGAIYLVSGKTGCFEVMKDPKKLILMFNKIAQNYKLKNIPKIPEEIIREYNSNL